MVSNLYLLLGLREDASWAEFNLAYQKLMDSLACADGTNCASPVKERVEAARQHITACFERPDVRHRVEEFKKAQKQSPQTLSNRPKLGQLLVAAGLLTLDELDSTLEIQHNTGNGHIPLGELLVATNHLTRQQLDYYLAIQRLFELPPDHPERWGNRLVLLGLVTDDQLNIALIEQKQTGCNLRQALIARGWLTAEVLDRIF